MAQIGTTGNVTGPASATDGDVVIFDGVTGAKLKDSNKAIVTTLGTDNTTIPTSGAVKAITDGKASTSHAATHLPSGTDPLSLYPITTTIYIDGNRIDTYTADGSISRPFKTISAAIAAATGNVGYRINIAPGTYSEASAVTFPNVPIVLYGNGAYVTFSGGVTIQNANYSRYDLFDTGNVTFSATGAGRIVVQGGSISGNITCNSLIDLKSVTLTAGVITVNSTATFLALGCTITSRIAGTGTAFIVDCQFTRADNSNAVIASTGGLCVVQSCIVTNTGSGGGISCANGASSTPNFILNNIITVGSGAPVACGTAATVYGKNEISGGTNTGTGLTPMNSDYIGPSQIVLGSDATGDMYYRSALAALARLAIGGSNTVIHGGTTPVYSAVVEADITLADNTTNDATTTKHGLLQKVVAGASSGIMNFLGTKYGETVSSWRALFDATVPAMDGSAATGSADTAARRDHVHASDTSRAPTASPTFTGTVTIPSTDDALVLSGTPPANGVVLIGDGTGFKPRTITPGSGITITNAAGAITIVNSSAGGGWTFGTSLVAGTDFSTTAASTSTITMLTNQTAKIPVGTPIQFTLSGAVYYAQVTALTSSLMTIRGAPLTTSASALTALSYGDTTRIAQATISFPGYYEAATTSTAINTNLLIPSGLLWDMTTAYCVGLDIQNGTADSGATQAIINAIINGNALDTSNSSSGLSISGTSLVRSVVDISTSYYTIARGQYIEVKITKGTNGDGKNLAVTLVFVIP